jgi:hypothetical protein
VSERDHYWSRRVFVGGIGATAAILYGGAVGRGALKTCGVAGLETALPVDFHALIRIGNVYLNELARSGEGSIPNDYRLDETQTRLADILGAIQRCLAALDSQAQTEFDRGETVTCDGWVLAKSEVRLCAMLAICARRYQSG